MARSYDSRGMLEPAGTLTMEPITHLMTGACLARAGFNRKAAYATLAMTLAAEAPDLDMLWAAGGPVDSATASSRDYAYVDWTAIRRTDCAGCGVVGASLASDSGQWRKPDGRARDWCERISHGRGR